jgi:hypothetical protein
MKQEEIERQDVNGERPEKREKHERRDKHKHKHRHRHDKKTAAEPITV